MKVAQRSPAKAGKRVARWSIFLALTCAALGLSAWRAQAWWSLTSSPITSQATPKESKQVIIQIPQGTSAQEIGQKLEAAGLIRSTRAWDIWSRWLMWQNSSGGFQAGQYELSTLDSMQAIADKIWSGKVAQRSFTVPEGWSIRQMGAYFEKQGYFPAKDFVAATSQLPLNQFPWLPKDAPHLEGYLFPDTYQLPAGAVLTPKQVIAQMLERFEQTALPIYNQKRGQTPMSLSQWVTLASIVEKEAVVPSERGIISGVFTNRLKKGMTLGSDPTVEYAFGIQQTPENPLTLAQVRTPHPYNTYVTPGLPPTAIASPGLASLKAALDPEPTEYLYFVARYDGTHVFSETLGDHEAAQGQIRDRVDSEAAAKSQEKPKPPTKLR